MESYCSKCKKNTKGINPEFSSTSNSKFMIKMCNMVVKSLNLLKNKKRMEY